MPINLSVEYPKLQNEVARLRYINEVLLSALKDIYSRSAYLDKGVNKAGDLQISSLWKLSKEAIAQAEQQ